MIGLIKETTRDRNIPIGKIDLMKKFSFFEVENSYKDLITQSFKNASHGDQSILVEESKPFPQGGMVEKPYGKKYSSEYGPKKKKKSHDKNKSERKR